MSHPRFVQIAAAGMKYETTLYALDEQGGVWHLGNFRPDGSSEDTPYKQCWHPIIDRTYAEAWPAPPPPKPTLESCLIQPPTIDEEAEHEVEALLK